MKNWKIYEEGFQVLEGSAKAHYLGEAQGETFIDACKNFIKENNRGEIREYNGVQYACDWGCKWYPTLEEAQKDFC